ncbi:hypothetical protein OUZ56_033234 [Daphnia magna]|uniref:Uncharacterized protein n=1 Tax=Daphnia magna TaxID=35525 RepID=A0ABQ9ZXG6_9CRUS|nr:hypothetical protein OUZ56_033234 [Daphnia magna]
MINISAFWTTTPLCVPTPQYCINRTTSLKIVGQSKLNLVTVAYMKKSTEFTVESATIIEKAPPVTTLETPAQSSDPELDISANKQYIEERATNHDKELVRMFKAIDCNVRKAKHEREIITAQYNGWLTASLLKLPWCTKLQAFGKTTVVIQHKTVNATFETVITPFGPQPKFK